MPIVAGRNASPMCSASYPSTRRRYSAPRKNIPNIPATDRIWIELAATIGRERKIRSGISGLRARASRAKKATSSPIEHAPSSSVVVAPQPSLAAGSTIVYTPSISAPVISRAPGTSAPARRPMPGRSGTSRRAARIVATPIGRLTKKIQCQLIDWVSTPPATRPTDPPAEATNANTPIALACSLGSGNIVTIIPRITAEVIAPPIPCTKRAVTSHDELWARPHSSEAQVNRATPARKTRRRPSRSPTRPASSNRPPKAIR